MWNVEYAFVCPILSLAELKRKIHTFLNAFIIELTVWYE